MKRVITLSTPQGKSYDIQVDGGQRIQTTLRVLGENIREFGDCLKSPTLREKRSGRKIELDQTYEEAKIYTGFELIILPKEEDLC